LIGTRILTLTTPSGEVALPVSIDAPTGSGQIWSCAYEIGWPSGRRRREAHGVDAIQALYQTLKMIGTDLYTSNEHRDGRLRWQKVSEGYGFPVPKNLRDLLVGSDKTFDG
jgi:hypothetical protein